LFLILNPFIDTRISKALVLRLNLSKKPSEALGSRQKGWTFLQQDNEICFFLNHQNEFKSFALTKTIWCIVMTFAMLWSLLDSNMIEISAVSLLILQIASKLYFYIRGINPHMYP